MRLAVTWEMAGYVDVEADTLEDAMEKFKKSVIILSFQTEIMQMEVLDCQQKMLMKWKLLQIFNETKIYKEEE